MSFRTYLVSAALVLGTLGLQGCAADTNEPTDETQVETKVATGEATPLKLGYKPNVTRADFVLPAGSCIGDLCTANGVSWDCKGGDLCTRISEW